ncbi:hypothetical protein QEH44_gp56 [Arthrobacter phage Shambre1]|uniref:Uncharacterized protein n=1 Tax=Arthrobacter phage Shambre1 TaxID=2927284 RepID=A0A977KPQ0_9CAUD|nr:hypothetical protein QEH44_gp56 [Arthrobacter phage Shambre1]UXE04792.1 hypothetical protein SEA_SHAMBRE1_56 [Arthrobacter phage Shambre1]
MNLEQQAGAARSIAYFLGAHEEWNNPAELLEMVADTLTNAGFPDPATAKDFYANAGGAELTPPSQPVINVHVDAAASSPEQIQAIFKGLNVLATAAEAGNNGDYCNCPDCTTARRTVENLPAAEPAVTPEQAERIARTHFDALPKLGSDHLAASSCANPVPVCVDAGAHQPPCRCILPAGHDGNCLSIKEASPYLRSADS